MARFETFCTPHNRQDSATPEPGAPGYPLLDADTVLVHPMLEIGVLVRPMSKDVGCIAGDNQ